MMTINKRFISGILVFSIFALMMISCGTTSSTTNRNSAEIASRQAIYMNHLREEGYVPSIDDDGDIQFKSGGRSYYIIITDDDPSLMFLTLFNIYTINSDSERLGVAKAISIANRGVKVAKMYLTNTNPQRVNVSVEAFLENPNDFKILFSRMLRALSISENDFMDAL